MSNRLVIALLVALAIMALTLLVSRSLGFTFLFLPLVFFWGRWRGRDD